MQEKDGKYIFGVVKVGDKGQIVIPKDARKIYGLESGDALLVLGDSNGIALVKTEIFQSVISNVMEGFQKSDASGLTICAALQCFLWCFTTVSTSSTPWECLAA